MLESIIVSCVAAVPLGVYYFCMDPNHDIKRHYHQESKVSYYALQLSLAILTLALVFHLRHVVFSIFSKLRSKVFG